MRLIKHWLRWMVFLTILLASIGAYYITRPLPLSAIPLQFSLIPGSSLKSVARQMQQAGVLSEDWTFVWLTRLSGLSTQIKAGNYQLETAVTLLELMNIVTQGQVTQNEISIIEGWTFNQFRTALNTHLAVRHDSIALTEREILQRIGIREEQAEGLFFPDTYYFSNGTSDLILLKRAYATMQQHLQQSWQTRSAGLPLKSPYQALILASIVEKETGKTADRSLIAAVFINRLRRGMMLQTDPTVIYGLGDKFDGNLHKRDLHMDTPYNTYTRAGLPPTPIALPGLAALQATLHPASSDALYFVSRGDGSSEFSATLTQHNRAVNRYQK
ncbi:MAG: endolytic transglycosylase MltG [Gallionellaceae bacterium]|nr:endolytic transglycosylase MltG [Gallionellaceae bacterium]